MKIQKGMSCLNKNDVPLFIDARCQMPDADTRCKMPDADTGCQMPDADTRCQMPDADERYKMHDGTALSYSECLSNPTVILYPVSYMPSGIRHPVSITKRPQHSRGHRAR